MAGKAPKNGGLSFRKITDNEVVPFPLSCLICLTTRNYQKCMFELVEPCFSPHVTAAILRVGPARWATGPDLASR